MATDWIILDVTSALKSDDTPRVDESCRYREPGPSQQVCAATSEISSLVSWWNVEGAYSNLSCTVVMEEGHQKPKMLSYTAKFNREFIRCAEEKGNRKAAAICGVNESNVRLWWKHNAAIRGPEASRRKFTGPKKWRFPEVDDAVFAFLFKRDARLDCLWIMIYFARRL
jgi:hypothetical protein